MKILDLCEFYSTRGGGVRSYLTRMASAAASTGHELVVVAPGERDEELAREGGRVVHVRGPRMPYDPTYHAPLRLDRMRAIVRRERPDVLQVSSPFLPAWLAASLRRDDASRVHTYVHHSDPIGCYLAPWAERRLPLSLRAAALAPAWAMMRNVTKSVDASVTAGSWLTTQLRAHGCERVHTVPFGIGHGAFSPDRRDLALRRRLLGKLADVPGARLLLITGRLAVDKRPHLLVDAALRLSRDLPVALVVLGDGPERARLQEQAAPLAEATFLPFLHDRAAYASMLASVDLLLHGSVCETFGFVIAETLLSGTPVIVPNAGAAPHMVDDGCAMIYEKDACADRIARAAANMLRRDPARVRESALAAAARHPTMDEHFERLFAFYEELHARKLRAPKLSRLAHRRAASVPSIA